jgi:hypothetical protein
MPQRKLIIRFSAGPELDGLAADDGAHVIAFYELAARDRFARLLAEEYALVVMEELARRPPS